MGEGIKADAGGEGQTGRCPKLVEAARMIMELLNRWGCSLEAHMWRPTTPSSMERGKEGGASLGGCLARPFSDYDQDPARLRGRKLSYVMRPSCAARCFSIQS